MFAGLHLMLTPSLLRMRGRDKGWGCSSDDNDCRGIGLNYSAAGAISTLSSADN